MLNKDFLRQVLGEQKKLLELSDVRWIEAPKYDELSVKSLFPGFEKDPEIMSYFPDRLPKGRLPERRYFFNVLNTVYPEFTSELIQTAQRNRNQASSSATDFGVVKVSDAWWAKLNEIPFLSSKCQFISNPQ